MLEKPLFHAPCAERVHRVNQDGDVSIHPLEHPLHNLRSAQLQLWFGCNCLVQIEVQQDSRVNTTRVEFQHLERPTGAPDKSCPNLHRQPSL